ncbi:MAG TPA: hypothetical protein DCR15_05695 [Arthrobacter bacterium]|nr:hypothetical protein [Arthrobacter sp.]
MYNYLRSLDNLKLILAIGIGATVVALALVVAVGVLVDAALFPISSDAGAIAGFVIGCGGGYLVSIFVARPSWEAFRIVRFDQSMQRVYASWEETKRRREEMGRG